MEHRTQGRLVIAPGLRIERVGGEAVVLDTSLHLVHRLTGEAAEVLSGSADGIVAAEVPQRLRPALRVLKDLGVLCADATPGVRHLPLDRSVARRDAIGLAAASAVGVATFLLPSAGASASTGTSTVSGVLIGGSEYAAGQPDASDPTLFFDYHRFATAGTFNLEAKSAVEVEVVLVGGGGRGSDGPGGGGGQVVLVTSFLGVGDHTVVVGAGATSSTGGSSSLTRDGGTTLATAVGGGGAVITDATAGSSPGHDDRGVTAGPFSGGSNEQQAYGGGGGAGGVGLPASGTSGGAGGPGRFVGGFFPPSAPATRFGGGGGGGTNVSALSGGSFGTATDGGGEGGFPDGNGVAAEDARGGGGGGAYTSGNGGSGLVVVRVLGPAF